MVGEVWGGGRKKGLLPCLYEKTLTIVGWNVSSGGREEGGGRGEAVKVGGEGEQFPKKSVKASLGENISK